MSVYPKWDESMNYIYSLYLHGNLLRTHRSLRTVHFVLDLKDDAQMRAWLHIWQSLARRHADFSQRSVVEESVLPELLCLESRGSTSNVDWDVRRLISELGGWWSGVTKSDIICPARGRLTAAANATLGGRDEVLKCPFRHTGGFAEGIVNRGCEDVLLPDAATLQPFTQNLTPGLLPHTTSPTRTHARTHGPPTPLTFTPLQEQFYESLILISTSC